VRRAFSDVGGHVVLGAPKSHQSWTVPIPLFLAREISAAITGKSADDLVFTMPSGSVLRLSNWRRAAFLPARSRARCYRPHYLRIERQHSMRMNRLASLTIVGVR